MNQLVRSLMVFVVLAAMGPYIVSKKALTPKDRCLRACPRYTQMCKACNLAKTKAGFVGKHCKRHFKNCMSDMSSCQQGCTQESGYALAAGATYDRPYQQCERACAAKGNPRGCRTKCIKETACRQACKIDPARQAIDAKCYGICISQL